MAQQTLITRLTRERCRRRGRAPRHRLSLRKFRGATVRLNRYCKFFQVQSHWTVVGPLADTAHQDRYPGPDATARAGRSVSIG